MVGHKGKFFPRKCDLRNETDIRSMFDWISSHPDLRKVDVRINNAGMSTAENLLEGSMESWRSMLDVNVGQIIMISSMSGHRVPPNPSTRFYSASKF